MGKDQELILAVRNQDVTFLNKVLQKINKSSKHTSSKYGAASGNGLVDHRRLSRTGYGGPVYNILKEHRSSTKKVNVNYQDADGMSGLHQAALMGHTEIMELLLENGASVTLKDNKGMIPLHYAAWQGKSEPVHILVQWKSPTNEQAQGAETPLHLACQHGHFDVVNLLLLHQASPIVINKDKKTPLDLACEFGRYRVVDLLLRSNLCSPLLADSRTDMTENKSTCIHLAAKNGHQDITRLLLQAGVNINRTTLQGTCLHEAALFGKTEVVKLLLDCGVDVNKPNSYDQTALDIVNNYTTSRASKEIKKLLKEASFCVQAKAVKDHCNIYDPNSLTFKEGDLIKIVEQSHNGLWKGSLMKDGCSAKAGWFPADHAVLIDNNAGRRGGFHISSSYISSSTPPLTPDQLPQRSASFSFNGGLHTSLSSCSRGSYGSIGPDDAFPPPPSPRCMSKFEHVNDKKDENGVHKNVTVLPPPPPPYQCVMNNGSNNQGHTGKVVVNHVGEHCYVDNIEPAYQNSWDMRSSSPSGSNRNSAASSDSGRGLSANYLDPKVHHNYVNVQVNNNHQQHRLSGTSYESGVSSRQSYHSTSSSSVGSLDRLEESGYSSQVNVADLFQAGYPDHEVLRAWLSDLHYEEYYQNFLQAGYDMPTITHMTPQDLTAIGISKPGHRKKLKLEISRLNIHDGIPDFKPNDLYDWLRMLGLDQYYNTLANQGYDNIDYVTDITWEDLEEIGIQKLGHQKKIMLAIDRLKRILSGTKRLSTIDGHERDSIEVLEPPMASIRWSGERSSPPPPAPPQYNELPPYLKPRRSSSGDSLSTNSSGEMKSLNQPLESEYANTSNLQPKPPAIVPIKVKRSMSQSTPNGISDGNSITQPKMCQSFHAPPDRTSDYSDRENTPTGDDIEQLSRSPVGIAPVAPRVAVKPKPIAKIVAKSKQSSREGSPDIIDIEKHEAEKNTDGYKSPVKNLDGFKYPLASNNGNMKRRMSDHIYDTPQIGPPRPANYVNYPPASMQQTSQGNMGSPIHGNMGSPIHVMTQFDYNQPQSGSPRSSLQNSPGGRAKKAPPPPPKRTNSIRSSDVSSLSKLDTNGNESVPNVASTSVASVLTPPPIQQKPQIPATPQTQAFVNCVQSLSAKFGKKSEEKEACDNMSSDGEDLPPPPPPVAMDIITPKVSNYGLLGKSDKTSSGEYMLQQRLKRENSASASPGNNGVESAFGVKLRQVQNESQSGEATVSVSQTGAVSQASVQDTGSKHVQNAQNCVQSTTTTTSGSTTTITSSSNIDQNLGRGLADKQRKDSTGSGGDISSSTSSLDSNTLPFANENVGTIKQRTPTTKPSLVMMMDDCTGQDVEAVFTENGGDSLKRLPNKLPKPQLQNIQKLQQQQLLQQRLHVQQTGGQAAGTTHPGQGEQGTSRQGNQPSYNASVTASYIPGTHAPASSEGSTRPSIPQKPKPAVSPKPPQKGQSGAAAGGSRRSGDVLSEIDNMLQGLTDELDAMLEFELTD